MKVALIDRSNREAVLEAAAKVDAILEKSWRVNGVKSQPALRDDQFLRRALCPMSTTRCESFLESKSVALSATTTRSTLGRNGSFTNSQRLRQVRVHA